MSFFKKKASSWGFQWECFLREEPPPPPEFHSVPPCFRYLHSTATQSGLRTHIMLHGMNDSLTPPTPKNPKKCSSKKCSMSTATPRQVGCVWRERRGAHSRFSLAWEQRWLKEERWGGMTDGVTAAQWTETRDSDWEEDAAQRGRVFKLLLWTEGFRFWTPSVLHMTTFKKVLLSGLWGVHDPNIVHLNLFFPT